MIIFKSATELSAFLQRERSSNRAIGFVPTMGALHNGHLSLIQLSNGENDLTVCSIFINPTQFTNAVDFDRYPVTIERDIEQLVAASCAVLFLPSAVEVYGTDYVPPHYDIGSTETLLEGKYRPGHFQGVCQVVDRLLSIISCDRLYLGQKDYQQCMVIQRLLHLTGRTDTVTLRIAPTVREGSGLAMSSRNMRLTEEQKARAAHISGELNGVRDSWLHQDPRCLEQSVQEHLSNEGFVVDYVSIADARTLEPLTSASGPAVCLVAATIGDIRLIDNMLLN